MTRNISVLMLKPVLSIVLISSSLSSSLTISSTSSSSKRKTKKMFSRHRIVIKQSQNTKRMTVRLLS